MQLERYKQLWEWIGIEIGARERHVTRAIVRNVREMFGTLQDFKDADKRVRHAYRTILLQVLDPYHATPRRDLKKCDAATRRRIAAHRRALRKEATLRWKMFRQSVHSAFMAELLVP